MNDPAPAPSSPTELHPLSALGAGPDVLAELAAVVAPDLVAGRVARVDRIEANVATAAGLRRVTDGGHGPLAVGDWVVVAPLAEPDDASRVDGVIRAVLPRRSALVRTHRAASVPQVLATNVDEVWVVMPVDQPADAGRLERLLVLAYDSGAVPRVVVTKADLGGVDELARAVSAAGESRFQAVSSATGEGISELAATMAPDRSAALIGVSGAGKSSLVNAIVGHELLRTGEVRASDSQGRHTTTWRELVALPGGGAIIDTPGLRSLGLWLDAGGIDAAFADVVGLAEQCRFNDCRHSGEPGCAVREAIDAGDLAARRWVSYQALRAEVDQAEERRGGGPGSRRPH